MPEIVQEYVNSRGQNIRFDPVNGVLRGVKLLGLESRNGRTYREQALRQAITLYEGAKVNVNHPLGDPLAARDYRDRLGIIRNVQLKTKEGLFGDLHYNPKHALAEQLAWDAEHSPENVGLSHNVLAQTARDGKQLIVEAITKVQSVDLVADPATTQGLFEQAHSVNGEAIVSSRSEEKKIDRTGEPAKNIDDSQTRLIASLESNLDELQNSNSQLIESLQRYQIQEQAFQMFVEHSQATSTIADDLHQFVSEEFVSTLTSLDEDQITTALKDRIGLLKLAESKTRAVTPQSIEQSQHRSLENNVVEETTQSFVTAITRS